MKKGISEIVGLAECVGKSSVTVYRALRSLMCAKCGALLDEGTLFTRRTLAGQGLRILPQCQKCAPFTVRAGASKRSALIESLLASSTEERFVKVRKSGQQEKIAEAVEQRLGPALRHARRVR